MRYSIIYVTFLYYLRKYGLALTLFLPSGFGPDLYLTHPYVWMGLPLDAFVRLLNPSCAWASLGRQKTTYSYKRGLGGECVWGGFKRIGCLPPHLYGMDSTFY